MAVGTAPASVFDADLPSSRTTSRDSAEYIPACKQRKGKPHRDRTFGPEVLVLSTRAFGSA